MFAERHVNTIGIFLSITDNESDESENWKFRPNNYINLKYDLCKTTNINKWIENTFYTMFEKLHI